MGEKTFTREWLNNFIITVFASAILGLGASHIYVLNKLAVNDERISSNEEAIKNNDKRYERILNKLEDTNLKLERLTTQIERMNEDRKAK